MNRELLTADQYMALVKRAYFNGARSFTAPTWLLDVPGFTDKFDEWVQGAYVCAERVEFDSGEQRVCWMEPQHNGAHFGADMTIGQGVGQ